MRRGQRTEGLESSHHIPWPLTSDSRWPPQMQQYTDTQSFAYIVLCSVFLCSKTSCIQSGQILNPCNVLEPSLLSLSLSCSFLLTLPSFLNILFSIFLPPSLLFSLWMSEWEPQAGRATEWSLWRGRKAALIQGEVATVGANPCIVWGAWFLAPA